MDPAGAMDTRALGSSACHISDCSAVQKPDLGFGHHISFSRQVLSAVIQSPILVLGLIRHKLKKMSTNPSAFVLKFCGVMTGKGQVNQPLKPSARI